MDDCRFIRAEHRTSVAPWGLRGASSLENTDMTPESAEAMPMTDRLVTGLASEVGARELNL
jgi:hypothetical protein